MTIKFRVGAHGALESCEGSAESLKAVFSHNIRYPDQRPEKGQFLGEPQQPENKHTDPLARRDADNRYAAVKDRLMGVYVPA